MYILSGNKKYYSFSSLSILLICCIIFINPSAIAFNDFQVYIEQKSKKQLNCAYCHKNPSGPEGNEPGQRDSLSEEQKQLTAYNQFLNTNKESVNSPILNKFGNYLVKNLGYESIVSAQNDPNTIVEKLKNSDLDQDGIKDSQELLDGTLPGDPLDGNPFKLFTSNLKRHSIEICFQAITILLLMFSLFKLKM